MNKRKEALSKAMAKAVSFTGREVAVMQKYGLDPDMAAFVITPKFVPGGVPEVPSKEDLDIIKKISAKLGNDVVIVGKYQSKDKN